jgi:hypothetical protein
MNKEEQKELKGVLEELNNELQNENLTQEQKKEIELRKARISGTLMSIWMPIGIGRKILMGSFFLIGSLGFFTQYEWLIWSFLIAGLFSPRLVGEISHKFGRMNKKV